MAANFYPRSPCGERRIKHLIRRGDALFLSTLSLRRATLCGVPEKQIRPISIHALLAESDARTTASAAPTAGFLSTLSLRRATWTGRSCNSRSGNFYPRSPCGERPGILNQMHRTLPISIHALLAESDGYGTFQKCVSLLFLSTLSLRRATNV